MTGIMVSLKHSRAAASIQLCSPAVGTFIEPAWVYSNRLFAILMPWKELSRGRAQYHASVGANYISLPPQLRFLRPLRSRHFLLSATCVMALHSNMLAVAFNGLFRQVIVDEDIAAPILHQYQPVIQNEGFHGSLSGHGKMTTNRSRHQTYTDPSSSWPPT